MYGITTSGIRNPPKNIPEILEKNDIRYIDCSITNLLQKQWSDIGTKDIKQLYKVYNDHGIAFSSLQSIFYGLDFDFSTKSDRQNILEQIRKLIEYCEILNTNRLLFGSPKQRPSRNRTDVFLETLQEVDSVVHQSNKVFSIENLEMIDGIEYPNANEILNMISTNSLKSCTLNLHLFVDLEVYDFKDLDFNLIDSIHISKTDYKTDFPPNSQNIDNIITLLRTIKCYKIVEFANEDLKLALGNIKKQNFLTTL